jgi:hypothetical protein
MVNNDNIEILEEADYQEQSVLSIKEIILRHIKKISDICCQEFTGGYWEKKPMKTSSGIIFTETYHEDIREMYCNGMDFLIDVIYPMGDKILKQIIEEHEKKDYTDIKEKLRAKRIIFKEINIMFERINFWQSSGIGNE